MSELQVPESSSPETVLALGASSPVSELALVVDAVHISSEISVAAERIPIANPPIEQPAISVPPPELLQLVLEQVVELLFRKFWDGSEISSKPDQLWLVPLQFAAVCCDWRRIALATPSLWSRIIIVITSAFKTKPKPYAAALQLQLNRAHVRNIRLLLIVDIEAPFVEQPEPLSLDGFVHVAKEVIQHCVDMTIMFVTGTTIEPIPDTAQHFRDLFQTDASNLKRMTLVLIDHGDESAPDRLEFLEMPFAWSVADSLDHLLLAFTVPRMPKGMIARCLTDLQMELDILPTQLIARMLNESPSLQRFTVNTTGIRADRPSEALTHATLGFFHISVQKMDTEDSLQAFHFPALKRAEILFDDGPDGVNLSPTNAEVSADHKRALIQSVCSGVDGLEQILIQRIEADESLADTLIALGLRHLKSLELANSILYASFWDKLAAHVEDFPCLTNLRCFNAVPTSEGHDYEALQEFIRTREAFSTQSSGHNAFVSSVNFVDSDTDSDAGLSAANESAHSYVEH